MGIPKNPDTIVIRNNFYPQGLREIDVWNYYDKNRDRLLKELKGRPVLLFIFISENQYVIRRFSNYKLIKITSNNFDKIINGRTVSLSIEQEDNKLDYFCIDIDPPKTLTIEESLLKDCVDDVLDFYSDLKIVRKTRITSSATSYHVYGYLNKNMNNDTAIKYLSLKLKYALGNKYSINSRFSNNPKINLDFTPMFIRGSHTAPWSLCRNGLICMDVTDNYETFNRNDAVVKRS